MPHGHLGRLHEAQNVHHHGFDIECDVQIAIIVPYPSTDDDQVNTTEFVENVIDDRCRIIVRHIDATHDGARRESLAQGFKSIEPAGQQSQTPPFAVQLAG